MVNIAIQKISVPWFYRRVYVFIWQTYQGKRRVICMCIAFWVDTSHQTIKHLAWCLIDASRKHQPRWYSHFFTRSWLIHSLRHASAWAQWLRHIFPCNKNQKTCKKWSSGADWPYQRPEMQQGRLPLPSIDLCTSGGLQAKPIDDIYISYFDGKYTHPLWCQTCTDDFELKE